MKRASYILLALVLANIAGALFGIIIYWDQLSATSPLLWIFVPDCPLYVVAFSVALILMEKKMQNSAISFIISAGLLKYGIWTLFVLAAFSPYFFSPRFALLNGILFILHIGMAAEALVLGMKKFSPAILLAALAWFLLNDFVDYFVGVHPYLPPMADIPFVAAFSFASTILLVPLLWLAKKQGWQIRILK